MKEVLVPLKLTPYAVAAALNGHAPGSNASRARKSPLRADTVLRLSKFFKTGAAFWMNIQARFDPETTEDAFAPQIKKIAPFVL